MRDITSLNKGDHQPVYDVNKPTNSIGEFQSPTINQAQQQWQDSSSMI